jgi:hypothetical protein
MIEKNVNQKLLNEPSNIEEYQVAYQNAVDTFGYDFLLFDESIIQFSQLKDPDDGSMIIRYTYYECPYNFISYDEYLTMNGFSYPEVGEEFREEYEQYLSEAKLKTHHNYIRYDYNGKEYQEAVHPASHLHVGLSGSMRIPICMVITPYIFSLFVVKQCYYDRWKYLMTDSAFRKVVQTSKVHCSLLNATEFGEFDKAELYLV